MKKRMVLIIILLIIIFGGTFGWDYVRSIFIKKFFANYKQPPVTVSTAIAKAQTWKPTLNAVGTLAAVNGVNVNSRVNGQVVKIYFKSGELVKKDQPLVQLDDSLDRQTLKNDLAQLKLAQLTYQRTLKVYQSTRGTSKSDVDSAQAKMMAAQVAVDKDKLNIQYKRIVAPFAGKIGIRQVNIGQYITAGQTLVSLQSLDPLYVDFSLPQQDIKDLYVNQPVTVTVDGYPDKSFKGKVTAINSEVDVATRTILVRATIPNPKYLLYPGIFANVKVQLPQQNNVVTVPQTAVTYSLYGNTAYVVVQKSKGKDGKPILIAQQRYITVGPRKGTVVAIKDGIKPNEKVVISGQIKLHNGAQVAINNKLKINE